MVIPMDASYLLPHGIKISMGFTETFPGENQNSDTFAGGKWGRSFSCKEMFILILTYLALDVTGPNPPAYLAEVKWHNSRIACKSGHLMHDQESKWWLIHQGQSATENYAISLPLE